MTPLQMIEEWKRGCSDTEHGRPEDCPECTRGLIDALERRLVLLDKGVNREPAQIEEVQNHE